MAKTIFKAKKRGSYIIVPIYYIKTSFGKKIYDEESMREEFEEELRKLK